ncbi:hypothetical protein Pelo_15294 [Pelomyxa schiedti]|nr:hypothetical protein Pelo_15294 [Pelomyxa schiedti]
MGVHHTPPRDIACILGHNGEPVAQGLRPNESNFSGSASVGKKDLRDCGMADEAQSRRQAELDLVHLPAVGRHGADARAPGREHDPILAEERQRRRREGRRWAGPAAPSHNGPDAECNELVACIWRDWVVSTSGKFALVIEERGGGGRGRAAADRDGVVTWSVAFDVSLTTMGMITRDVAVSDAKASGVTVLKKQQPGSGGTYLWLHKAESAAVDSLGRMERHVRNYRGLYLCGALNGKWWVTLGWRARANGASITISTPKSSQGIPKERTKPDVKVSMLLPESSCHTMRMFRNNTVPDEVLLTLSCCETTTISFTLFDVLKTYESQKFTALIQTSTESRQDSFGYGTSLQLPDAALVLRRKKTDGAVIFIVKSYGNFVFQVEADTGTARVLSARCSDLSQLDDCVFCVGMAWDNSYQLWDCNNTHQPLRCTNCGDTFDQVFVVQLHVSTTHSALCFKGHGSTRQQMMHHHHC